MSRKEVNEDNSSFDHVAALNKAGFTVKAIRKFERKKRRFNVKEPSLEFDLGKKPYEVEQQAVLMGLLDRAKNTSVIEEVKLVVDQKEQTRRDLRRVRKEGEKKRLTMALNSVLNNVSPNRKRVEVKKAERVYKRKSVQPQQHISQNDVDVRVAMRELFGGNNEMEKVKSSGVISLFKRILDYKFEIPLPAWSQSLFRSDQRRADMIHQLKEVYK